MQTKTVKEIIEIAKSGKTTVDTEVNEIFCLDFDLGINTIFTCVTFLKSFSIKGVKSKNGFSFINCTFKFYFNFSDINGQQLYFKDCVFEKQAIFRDLVFKSVILKNCYFKEGLFSEKLLSNNLELDELKSDNSRFDFFMPSIEVVEIYRMKDLSSFLFTSISKDQLNSHGKIGGMSIRCDIDFSGIIVLYKTLIDTLSITGFNKNGRLLFQDIKLGIVSFSQFSNSGFLNASKIETQTNNSIIQLFESNLGNAELFDIDFTKFKSVKICNSNIQDIVPTNISWCNNVETNIFGGNVSNNHLRETFRQLKTIMVKIGDKVEELKYYGLEMDAYSKYLKIEKKNWEDRVIFCLGKWSNNHGLSWLRAFVILICFSFFVFNLNKFLLGYNSFKLEFVPIDLANWIESINPIRKFENVYKIYKKGFNANLALLIDIVSRIIYSFLIFQFVSAFRKYVKK